VVIFVTPVSNLLVVNWIHHGYCIQHRLEALEKCIDFFIIFGKWGVI
jgi:hypothetical protein